MLGQSRILRLRVKGWGVGFKFSVSDSWVGYILPDDEYSLQPNTRHNTMMHHENIPQCAGPRSQLRGWRVQPYQRRVRGIWQTQPKPWIELKVSDHKTPLCRNLNAGL